MYGFDGDYYYVQKKRKPQPISYQYVTSYKTSPKKKKKPKIYEIDIVYAGNEESDLYYDGDNDFVYEADFVFDGADESDSSCYTFHTPRKKKWRVDDKKQKHQDTRHLNYASFHELGGKSKRLEHTDFARNDDFKYYTRGLSVDQMVSTKEYISPNIKKNWNLPQIPKQLVYKEESSILITDYDIETYRKHFVAPSPSTAQIPTITVSDCTIPANNYHKKQQTQELVQKHSSNQMQIQINTFQITSDEKQFDHVKYRTDKQTQRFISAQNQYGEDEIDTAEMEITEDRSNMENMGVSTGTYINGSSPGIYCIPLDVQEYPYEPEDETLNNFSDALFKVLKGDDSFKDIIVAIERGEALRKAFDLSINFDRSQLRNKKLKKGVRLDNVLKKAMSVNMKFTIPKTGSEKRLGKKISTVSDFKAIVDETCTKKDVQLLMGNRNDWLEKWEIREQEEIEKYLINMEKRPSVQYWMNHVEDVRRRQSSGSILLMPPKQARKIRSIDGETDAERWERVKANLFTTDDQVPSQSTRKKITKKSSLKRSKQGINHEIATESSSGYSIEHQKESKSTVSFASGKSNETQRSSSVRSIHKKEDEELLRKYSESTRYNRRDSAEIRDESDGRLFGNTIFATPTYTNFETGWHEEISLYKIEKMQQNTDYDNDRHIFISRSFDNTQERPTDAQVMAKQAKGVYDNGGAYVTLHCRYCQKWESDSCSEKEHAHQKEKTKVKQRKNKKKIKT